MWLVHSVIGPAVGMVLQFVLDVLRRDRRLAVLERRARVLNIVKEMRAAHVTPAQLRQLERRLTKE